MSLFKSKFLLMLFFTFCLTFSLIIILSLILEWGKLWIFLVGWWSWSGSNNSKDSHKLLQLWNDNGLFEGICEGPWQGSWDWIWKAYWCIIEFKEAWKDQEKALNREEQKSLVNDFTCVILDFVLYFCYVSVIYCVSTVLLWCIHVSIGILYNGKFVIYNCDLF